MLRARLGRGPLAAVLFFIGTLVPALGFFDVYPFRFSFVADHFQYLASIGLIALAVGSGATLIASRGVKARIIGAGLAGAVVLVLGTLSFVQTRIYADLETLWRDTIDKNPNSFMPRYNLGNVLAGQGRSAEAIEQYRRALELRPQMVQAMNNLGVEHAKLGRHAEAIEWFENALRVDPDFPDALHGLGAAYGRQGRIDESIELLSRAIAHDPTLLEARVDLAIALVVRGDRERAADQLRTVLRIQPGNSRARELMERLKAARPIDPKAE
jgi:tetratricopeptide (TPR) repeat protein